MQVTCDCPSSELLKELLDGALAADDQARVSHHLEKCAACQQSLEAFVAGKQSWAGAKEQLAAGIGNVDASLAAAVERAKRVPPNETESESEVRDSELLHFLKPSSEPGSIGRLGPYEVMQVVGRGGFGVVLKAFDSSLRRVVAIKVLSPRLATSSTARRRFVREARAAAAVNHDHVVAIHAVEEAHEPPYFVMQFVEGKTLQDRLDSSGPLALNEILRIGMQASAGLAAAHDQGLVHRDIKPANILLENGVERVKITDFGLARTTDDASLTQSGVVAGTPQFMSPEQANGESVDARADLFSLGSVLYAMCTGRAPFRSSTTMGVLKRVCEESARPIREVNSEMPEWLEAIITKLHAKRPADRFQSARELCDLLARCLAHVQQPSVAPLPAVASATAAKVVRDSTRVPMTGEPQPAPAAPVIAMPHVGAFERIVRFVIVLMGVGGLVQLVIWLLLAARGLAHRWVIAGFAAGFGLLLLAAVAHLLRLRTPQGGITANWDRRSGHSSRPSRIAVILGVVMLLTGALLLVRWAHAPQWASRPITDAPVTNIFADPLKFNDSSAGFELPANVNVAHDSAANELTIGDESEMPQPGLKDRQPEVPPEVSASSSTPTVATAPDALITALRDLVEQRTEEFNRIKRRHSAGAAATDELLVAQKASLEALARLAKAENKMDDMIRFYEQVVQVCEKRVEHAERLYAAGGLAPTELTQVRSEMAEARIQLETARR
jgi:anti-sigma factor RsiW